MAGSTRMLLLLTVVVSSLTRIQSVPPTPCKTRLECPSTNILESSGNGSSNGASNTSQLSTYTLSAEKSQLWSAQGQLLEVKLQFRECIPFNRSAPAGPKHYKLEAISEATGNSIGQFFPTPLNSESELCDDNVISFKTNTPTVLDIPRTYRWKPTSKEAVCFRATIFHYPDNVCETLTKCVSADNLPPVSTAANQQETSTSTIILPPPAKLKRRLERCERNWKCDDPTYRNITMCGCLEENKGCITFPKKCELKKYQCIHAVTLKKYSGACAAPTPTPPPPPPTTPPPPPIRGFCKLYSTTLMCTDNGDYKLTQCTENEDGSYECFCVNYDFGFRYGGRTITRCDSPDTYDLNCVR